MSKLELMLKQILRKHERLFKLLIIFTGVSSIVTQLLTIRECYAQFHGNVYVIAMILFIWLIAGAVGTLFANICTDNVLTKINLGLLCIILAVLPGIQILTIRFLKHFIFIPGSEIGFYQTFIFVACTCSPYALLIGFALPFTYFVYNLSFQKFEAEKVYIYDSAGDALGGLIFSFILVQTFTPIRVSLLINLPLLMTSMFLIIDSVLSRKRFWIIILIMITLFLTPLFLEHASLNIMHKGSVHYAETGYGRIQLFQNEGRSILVTDGIPQDNERNISFEESIVHFGLSQVQKIHRVLTISANKGILLEIGKYKPKFIENIEIDPVKGKLEQQYGFIPHTENLKTIFTDGRKYIQESRSIYDAVVLNLPEPDTFQVNRFYTQTFFQIVRSKMGSDGVIVFSIDGFDSYLSKTRIIQISSLYQTALSVFPNVRMYPGERIYFVCGNKPLQLDIPDLLVQKNIQTKYVQYYFYGDISQQRIQYLHNQLIPSVLKNQDNRPVLVRMTVDNWLSAFQTDLKIFVSTIILLFCLGIILTNASEFVLFSSGMTLMGFEVLLIFLFQMRMGNVYYQVCWIVTCFLIGLVPGAYYSSFYVRNKQISKHFLLICDISIILMIIAFLMGLTFLPYNVPLILFLCFGFFLSMLCGFQFPLVLQLQNNASKGIPRIFAADILGASFGIVLVSVIGIPYFGLTWTALGLGMVKLVGLIRSGKYRL
jgi:spermidine synthase